MNLKIYNFIILQLKEIKKEINCMHAFGVLLNYTLIIL